MQLPRIPIWVVGAWPRQRSLARALRFDGVIPAVLADDRVTWVQPTPDALERIVADIATRPPSDHYEIIVEGNSSRDANRALRAIAPYGHAGATWWLEGVWSFLREPDTAEERMTARIEAGPPIGA